MTWQECDERAHIEDSLANGDFMPDDQLDDDTFEAHCEWAEEANQHFTAIFNRVTSMLIRNVIKQEDAAFILKEASDGQGWLENFVPGQDKQHQQI